jgi:cell division septal protein FtsQ
LLQLVANSKTAAKTVISHLKLVSILLKYLKKLKIQIKVVDRKAEIYMNYGDFTISKFPATVE